MRYICLWYADPPRSGSAASGGDDLAGAQRDWTAELRRRGRITDSGSLDRAAASSLRVRDGSGAVIEVADAAAATAPAGYFVIVARDYNDGLRLAGESPAARRGRIALYPVIDAQ